MEEIKKAIDTLTDKVTSLEAELHVAQESLAEQIKNQDNADYDAIQEWATQEFKADLLDEVMTSVKESIDENNKHVAEGIQNWVNEAITPEIQNWIVEEFTPEIQNWITEEYSDKVQNWITEEFGSTIEGWVNEEFAATVEGWINEEFAPSQKEAILNEAYENVNMFIESKKEEKLDFIDKMLEGIDTLDSKTALDKIVKEQEEENKFKGVYVVENMPNQYKPLWNGLSESKQNEIIRSSRMYDFTKEGVLESFWANADLTEVKTTKVNESVDVISNYHNNIAEQMKRYGKWY